jgi:hypothetical protein
VGRVGIRRPRVIAAFGRPEVAGDKSDGRGVQPMKRPVGVTALSLFSLVGAALSSLAAFSLAFPDSPLEPMWQLNPRGHQGFQRMHGWGVPLLFGVSTACGFTGIGLWRRRRWGYRLALVGLSIHLVGDVVSVVSGTEPRAIVGIPVVAALIVYLTGRNVRLAFGGGEQSGRQD